MSVTIPIPAEKPCEPRDSASLFFLLGSRKVNRTVALLPYASLSNGFMTGRNTPGAGLPSAFSPPQMRLLNVCHFSCEKLYLRKNVATFQYLLRWGHAKRNAPIIAAPEHFC